MMRSRSYSKIEEPDTLSAGSGAADDKQQQQQPGASPTSQHGRRLASLIDKLQSRRMKPKDKQAYQKHENPDSDDSDTENNTKNVAKNNSFATPDANTTTLKVSLASAGDTTSEMRHIGSVQLYTRNYGTFPSPEADKPTIDYGLLTAPTPLSTGGKHESLSGSNTPPKATSPSAASAAKKITTILRSASENNFLSTRARQSDDYNPI